MHKKIWFSALLIALSAGGLFFQSLALGFGDVGHLTVCEIAWNAASKKTRTALSEILGQKHDGKFAQQCIWPDEVKRTPNWKSTAPFHFINIETMMGEEPASKAAIWDDINEFSGAGDMLQAIMAAKAALDPANTRISAAGKLCHLRFLGHLAGDSHQPMHYGKKSDFGGNSVQIYWRNIEKFPITSMKIDANRPECFDLGDEEPGTGNNCVSIERLTTVPTNLHVLWDDAFIDTKLIEERKLIPSGGQIPNPFSYFKSYAKELETDLKLKKNFYKQQSILQWAEQTSAIRRSHAYADLEFDREVDVLDANGQPRRNAAGVLLKDKVYKTKISEEDYYKKRIEIIERQLLTAGYHFAGLLDRIFDPGSVGGLVAYHKASDMELAARISRALPLRRQKENEIAKLAGKPEPYDSTRVANTTLDSPCDKE